MNLHKALFACGAVIVGSAALQVVAYPVQARPRPVVVLAERAEPAERVSYRDLNLTSAVDLTVLNGRVRAAVRTVCAAPDQGIFSVVDSGCRWEAWNSAQPQISRAVEQANQMARSGASTITAATIIVSAP